MQPMTRKQLDAMQCQMPGCTHENHENTFYFHARCHMEADCEVSYNHSTGLLTIDCGECGNEIAVLKVAAK